MVSESFNELRLGIAEFMNADIINTSLFYMDYWGLSHILVGFLVMMAIARLKVEGKTKKYLIVLTLALLWESFEWFFYSREIFFAVDTPANVGWDVIMNMFGAWIYLNWRRVLPMVARKRAG